MAVWHCCTVLGFSDDEVAKTCCLVDFHTVSETFLDTLKLSHTVKLCYDDRVEWIPVSDNLASLHNVAWHVVEISAIRHRHCREDDIGVDIHKSELSQSTYDNLRIRVIRSGSVHCTELIYFYL